MKKWHERQEEQDSDKMNSVERNANIFQTNRKFKHKKNIACGLANEDDCDYTEIENPLLVPKESVSDIGINESLSSEKQKHLIREVFKDYEDVLTNIPGRTTSTEHTVTLKSEKPTNKKPYIMTYALRKQVDIVKSMLTANITEKSNTAYFDKKLYKRKTKV